MWCSCKLGKNAISAFPKFFLKESANESKDSGLIYYIQPQLDYRPTGYHKQLAVGEKPVIVIPIAGPKASGKTTLLNAMMGGR